MDILNVGRSAVYKRISGTILLNVEELRTLIQHFQIDPSLLFDKPSGHLDFIFPPLYKDIENQGDFLGPIIEELKVLANSSGSKIRFLATGFPIFYFFFHKEIAHFKFYIFQNSVWEQGPKKLRQFNLREIEHDYHRLAQYEKVRKLYALIDSEEVWTGNIFRSTIEDIKNYLEAGLFKHPEEAIFLVDKLLESVDCIAQMIQTGNKSLMSEAHSNPGKLTVYHNSLGRFGSNILTSSKKGSRVYLTYDLPNYLVCENPEFTAYTESWMDKVKHNSLPLSATSDLERLKFFNQITEAIKRDRRKLKSLIPKQRLREK